MKYFRSLLQLLGSRVALTVFVTILAAFCLGLTEYLFASFLDQFMGSLGVTSAGQGGFDFVGIQLGSLSPKMVFVTLVVILITRGCFQLLSSYGSESARAHFILRLREKLIDNIIWEKLESRTRLDEIGNLLGEIFPKAGEAIISLSKSVVAFTQCVVLMFGMLHQSYWLSIVVVSGTLVIGIVAKLANKKILSLSRKVPVLNQKVVDSTNQSAQNKIFIGINGMQEEMQGQTTGFAASYCRFMLRSQFYRHGLVAVLPILGLTMLFAAILFLPQNLGQPKGIFAFIILFVRFTQSLGNTANFLSAFTSFRPHFKLAYEFYFQEVPRSRVLQPSQDQSYEEKVPGIRISDLSHGWDKESLFNDLSFEIDSGSVFGFVGKSGSGKSTLMQILLGVISPKVGKVEIDGLAPNDWLQRNSSRVGYVGVHPFLINGSIRENLCYGVKSSFDDKELWQALREVNLEEPIRGLERGLDAPLNEYGDGLSSGQKQRLALARSLLKKPLLLVLDEPTANLDEKSEREVLEMIETFKRKMTVILVCHKANYSYIYDRYLDLESFQVMSSPDSGKTI